MKDGKWYARLRKLSVKWKIFLLSVLVFGLSLTVGFAYFTYQSYWLVVASSLNGLMNFTDAKQQGVIRFIDQNEKLARQLASLVEQADAKVVRSQFQTAVASDVFRLDEHPFKDEIVAGKRTIPTWKVYHAIDYVVNGVIRVSSDPQREGRDWNKNIDLKPGYSDPYYDGDVPVMTFASRMKDGTVYVHADARMLTNIVSGEIGNLAGDMGAFYLAGVGKTFDFYIVNKKNLLITESRARPGQLLKGYGSVTPWLTTLQQAGVICGKTGVYTTNAKCTTGCREAMGFYIGATGKKMLGASMPFYDSNWTLVVEQEADDLLWPMWMVFAQQLGMLLVIGGLSAYLYLRLQDKALIRPLAKLQEAIEEMEKTQDFSKQIKLNSQDELGVLADAFNRMSRKLENIYNHLEQRVANRTRELEALNKQVNASLIASHEAQKQIENLAFFDTLTHLPNRRLLMDRLNQALANSARQGKHGAIMFIDLDNFKNLNDTKGHAVGDLLLIEVARRLQLCVREEDTVARLGGDEFVLLLSNLSENHNEASAAAKCIADQVLIELNHPYFLNDIQQHSSPSIGITLFCNRSKSVDELLKQADNAMYESKRAGRNTLRFYDQSIQALLEARNEIENALRYAVEKNQLQLHYQIQINEDGRGVGAEVLLRWIHPDLGMVPPAQFIPVAEESGLILPIGSWVLEMACAQLKCWQDNPLMRHLVLAVNVSSRQFRDPGFAGEVESLLNRSGINPACLKLEITESMLLDNVANVIAVMTKLKSLGLQFSMDDFGTGYSSLSYIKKLPLDQLKIDQSFVRDLVYDRNDRAIVNSIIAMARSMEIEVIAEGVETEEQHRFLTLNGCINFQGYLFSKPLPLDVFEQLVREHHSGAS